MARTGDSGTIRVELHCHSTASDGVLTPEQLADCLADSGVVVAALTDHDSVAGLERFARAARRRGLAVVNGLEMTVDLAGREIHLLAYGFDPTHPEVLATWGGGLPNPEPGSFAESILRLGWHAPAEGEHAPLSTPVHRIAAADAIAVVHRAGGRVVVAHPMAISSDAGELRATLRELAGMGLDGVEAVYGPATAAQRQELLEAARELGLLVSGGTDLHAPRDGDRAGIDLPVGLWKELRDAVSGPAVTTPPAPLAEAGAPPKGGIQGDRRRFLVHIVVPSLLAIVLFTAAVFALLLPSFERSLLDRKRELIRELVATAWSVLAEAEAEERAGRLSRAEAQELARTRIAAMRYGREGKDYFWIQDLQPRIVMHPYRRDLEGQDVSDFRDARGVRIFVEFADLVRRQQEGYIEYVWQWKDDPRRLAPKESYIRGFPRWQWVIGTGIYLDDVRHEISRLERDLVYASGAIVVLVAALLLWVVREGLGLERERSRAEDALRESTQRYRSLVESARDGTLLVLEGRLRYANPVLLERLGYSPEELELRDLEDLVPREEGNQEVWSAIERAASGQDLPASVSGALRHRDGRLLEAVLTFSPITFAGERGFILHERDPAGGGLDAAASEELARAAASVRTGIVRALPARRGTVIAANPAAARLLASLRPAGRDDEAALADLFAAPEEWQEARRELIAHGEVARRLAVAGDEATTRILDLRAVAVPDEAGQICFVDAVVEDVTAAARGEAERRLLLERLQASLLFLYEPVRTAARDALACSTDTTLEAAAALMTREGSRALLVQGPGGEPLGLLSDEALRRHVGRGGRDLLAPAFKAMIAPLATVSDSAPVYEALLRLEESGVAHVAVEDEGGQVVGIVDAGALLQFQSYGSFVLTREVARAASVDEVARCCRRLPAIATSLLDSGAQARHITRMVASVADAATERFLALACDELGPPPTDFAWMALGSQGRLEQTLFTDQDNAIVYASTPGAEEATHAYFVAVARRVTEWLDRAGYRLCPGDVMASNPLWCQPLEVWRQYFRAWIREAQPKQLIEMSILFDMRTVCGASALVRDLRREIHDCLRAAPDFYPLFARNAVEFRPPPRLFGKILPGGAGGDSLGRLDLKDAMHPIVAFARLYALRHELDETHTVERLRALAERDLIQTTTRDEVAAVYDFLMRLRLQHQAGRIRIGAAVDNVIHFKRLGHADLTLLKQAFAEIDAVQRKVSFEFLGGL